MAYNGFLADRIRQYFSETQTPPCEEKKMMGGLAFMVDGKMCVGIVKDELMVRVGPDAYDECLKKPGCRPMNFTGRAMRGFVFVGPEGYDADSDLQQWMEAALAFNPLAKASPRKKKA